MSAIPIRLDRAPAAVLERDVRRRVAARLLPFLFLLYIVNYVDRTNLAYAALGMSRELGFSDQVFGLGSGVFFVSYLALQIPGALLVEQWSARRMISAAMITWGSLTALTALVQTPGQLYAARFLLGAAEAGFFPGVVVYLSHWFVREDRAKATSNFMGAIPLSSVVASLFAGWILGHRWLALAGWRWLFFLEGVPAVVLGVAAYFYLTDWPREAAWLAPAQRTWIQETLRLETPGGAEPGAKWRVLGSPTVLRLAGLTFLAYLSEYAFIFWFPTLLKRATGVSDGAAGVLGAIPYVVAFLAMQINAWHSDKTRDRRWHSALPLLIAAAAVAGLMGQPRSLPVLLTLFSLASLVFAYLPTFWAVPTELLGHTAAAAAVGFINAVGSAGGFAGPYLFGYLNTHTGSTTAGLGLILVSAAAGGLGLLWALPVARKTPGPPG